MNDGSVFSAATYSSVTSNSSCSISSRPGSAPPFPPCLRPADLLAQRKLRAALVSESQIVQILCPLDRIPLLGDERLDPIEELFGAFHLPRRSRRSSGSTPPLPLRLLLWRFLVQLQACRIDAVPLVRRPGPSSKTWPRCPSQRAHSASVRTIPRLRSVCVFTLSGETGA